MSFLLENGYGKNEELVAMAQVACTAVTAGFIFMAMLFVKMTTEVYTAIAEKVT
jgi:hypothetical protein